MKLKKRGKEMNNSVTLALGTWAVVGLLFWVACNCQGLSELIYNFLR